MHTAHCTPRVYHLESHLSWASCHAAPLVQLPKEQFWMQLGHNRSQPCNNHEKQPSKKFNFSQHCEQAVTPSNTVRFHYCFTVTLIFDSRKGLVWASKQRHFSDSNCPFHAVNCFQVRNSRIRFSPFCSSQPGHLCSSVEVHSTSLSFFMQQKNDKNRFKHS